MAVEVVFGEYTQLNNSIRTADELSTKLPVTDLNPHTKGMLYSNLHRYKYFVSQKNIYEDMLFYQDKRVARRVLSCYPEYTKKYRNILSYLSHSIDNAGVVLNKIERLKRQIRDDIVDIQSVIIHQIDTSYWVDDFTIILQFLDKIKEYVNANYTRKNISARNYNNL